MPLLRSDESAGVGCMRKGVAGDMNADVQSGDVGGRGDSETLEFQAEARQLLQLVIHSIYSNKDIFLRELISNASDALDKLRLAAFQDKDLDADVSDLHIEISVEKARRRLTVRDNGIGMSRDEG